jgi:hypothetical protein
MSIVDPDPELMDPNDYYLCRVGWWPDGSVMAQVQNRKQNLLQLIRLDPKSGQRQVMVEERCLQYWINLHHMLHMLPSTWKHPDDSNSSGSGRSSGSSSGGSGVNEDGNRNSDSNSSGDFYFIWASEHTGFTQLYLFKYDSALRTAVSISVPTGADYATSTIKTNGTLDSGARNEAKPIGGGGEWIVDSIDAVDSVQNIL